MSREEAAEFATRRAAASYAIRDNLATRNAWAMADAALAAADAHDAANGIHRVSLDDATVERAAVALYVHNNPVGNWSAHSARVKTPYRDAARAVLAAAVEAGQ